MMHLSYNRLQPCTPLVVNVVGVRRLPRVESRVEWEHVTRRVCVAAMNHHEASHAVELGRVDGCSGRKVEGTTNNEQGKGAHECSAKLHFQWSGGGVAAMHAAFTPFVELASKKMWRISIGYTGLSSTVLCSRKKPEIACVRACTRAAAHARGACVHACVRACTYGGFELHKSRRPPALQLLVHVVCVQVRRQSA
jgi:hypothetical protein